MEDMMDGEAESIAAPNGERLAQLNREMGYLQRAIGATRLELDLMWQELVRKQQEFAATAESVAQAIEGSMQGTRDRAMNPAELRAIQERNEERKSALLRHTSDSTCLSMAACCEVGTGETIEPACDDIAALVAEVERLRWTWNLE